MLNDANAITRRSVLGVSEIVNRVMTLNAKSIFYVISLQNDDIETDINKLRPRHIPIRPFDELRPFERFFPEFSEDFQVELCL